MREKARKMRQKEKPNMYGDSSTVEQRRMVSPLLFLNLDDQQQYCGVDSIEKNKENIYVNRPELPKNSNTVEQRRMESPLLFLNLDDQQQYCDVGAMEKNKLEKTSRKRRHYESTIASNNIIKRKMPDKDNEKHKDEQPLLNNDLEKLNVEHVDNLDGHRIVEIGQFINDLRKISSHDSLFDCGLDTLKIVSEKRKGLVSEFNVTCQMCNKKFRLKNSSEDVNRSAVSGMMAAGCGYAQLNQFTAATDLPNVSEFTYNKAQDQVCNEWELTASEEMKKAGDREREAAIKEGRVNKDGVAMIDVVLDGSWCKRSYKNNFSASSGAAAIIGRRFGQVIYMSVKNKFCCICARAEKNIETVKQHTCYKNFCGPSTAMEASIIVEGFKESIETHKLIYSRFIADGDSSTYAKILEARPYPNHSVEKINCKNHILRNFCNKLQNLKTDTKYSVSERKIITNESILCSRKYITESIKLHGSKTGDKTENIKSLHQDIILALYHGFGIHYECNKEICSRETKCKNTTFTNSHLWQRMRFVMASVAAHARSLIENVDSNIVECFNGVIAKFIGGKRVNYALRRSYQARCAGAVVSFNSGKILSTVRQNIYKEAPSDRLKTYEYQKDKKRYNNRQVVRKKKRYTAHKIPDMHYGEKADKPDMDLETYEMAKIIFLKNLEKTEEEKRDIERRTVLQSDSGEWLELRRNLLTASNFGKVVKRKIHNSCKNIVKNMLYKPNIDHVASICHGKKNESTALEQLSSMFDIKIAQCGLFIDEKHPFLGATPDGIIDEDTIVEVKCPVAPYKIGLTEAIQQGKMHFWRKNKENGDITVNKMSDWYMQVQGQLHISKKNKCLLAVWYGNSKIKTELIKKDDQFWYETMEPKLISFYFDCLLPELIDPRFIRKRPIRDPVYVKATRKNVKEVVDKENIDNTMIDSGTNMDCIVIDFSSY